MKREAILDLAQEHLMLNNRSCWVGNDDEVVDFAKALLVKLDAPVPPDGIWMKREGDSFTFTGEAIEPGKQYTVTVSPHEAAELEAESAPAPPEVAVEQEPVSAKVEEIRELLGEAYRFNSTSPRAQSNINAALDLLDEIAKPVAAGLPAIPEGMLDLLRSIADFMTRSVNCQQAHDMPPDYASEFDYNLAQAASEIESIVSQLAAAPVLPVEQPSQPQDQSGCDSALHAEPAGQHGATVADAIDALLKEADSDYTWGGSEDENGDLSNGVVDFDELRSKIRALLAEASALPVPRMGGNTISKASICVCGEPETVGTVHRTDGPCYIAEPDTATQAPSDDALRDAIAEGLRGLYGCGRVWSAWNVGTMSEDDFYPAEESDECISQMLDAIRSHLKGE